MSPAAVPVLGGVRRREERAALGAALLMITRIPGEYAEPLFVCGTTCGSTASRGGGFLLLGDVVAVAQDDNCGLRGGGRGGSLGVAVVGTDQLSAAGGLEFKPWLDDLELGFGERLLHVDDEVGY